MGLRLRWYPSASKKRIGLAFSSSIFRERYVLLLHKETFQHKMLAKDLKLLKFKSLKLSKDQVVEFTVISIQVADLARLSHENTGKLLGYCRESSPFSRMLVFEYASNGTLYEHLHCKLWCFLLSIFLCLIMFHQLRPESLFDYRWRRMPIILDTSNENYNRHCSRIEVSSLRNWATIYYIGVKL